MNYAVIAAGEGSRLTAEGVKTPKALLRVGGIPLIDRLLAVFSRQRAEAITIVCRDDADKLLQHLDALRCHGMGGAPLPLHVVRRCTSSSMHSLWAMRDEIGDAPCIVTTVDTLFRPDRFACYAHAFESAVANGGCDAMMGVTTLVDDERPLYVQTDHEDSILAFHDADHPARYVSAGIYGLTPSCWPVLERCVAEGMQRMRRFQQALVDSGLRLCAHDMGEAWDIDHAADILKAEKWLATEYGDDACGSEKAESEAHA